MVSSAAEIPKVEVKTVEIAKAPEVRAEIKPVVVKTEIKPAEIKPPVAEVTKMETPRAVAVESLKTGIISGMAGRIPTTIMGIGLALIVAGIAANIAAWALKNAGGILGNMTAEEKEGVMWLVGIAVFGIVVYLLYRKGWIGWGKK